MPALFEEFLLRGLLYGSLRHLLDKHVSVAIVAGLFTLIHPQYEWYVQLFYVLRSASSSATRAPTPAPSGWACSLHMVNNCLSIVLPQFF